MKAALQKFEIYLDRPIAYRARFLIALMVIPLLASFAAPLWNISMQAPQYPEGLEVDVYSYQVVGGNDGNDIAEINVLNHYIGMAAIEGKLLEDLDWIPFLLGFICVLILRAAAIGNIRTLIDLAVIYSYIGGFLAFRFWLHLYTLGHNLDPKAPVNVDPFMPAIFGSKQIANFQITSFPRAGAIAILISVGGVLLITFWHLATGFRESRKNASKANATTTTSKA
jgi:copper chaperone NosL